jgi:hypothetical protein
LIQTNGWTHPNYRLDEQGTAARSADYVYPPGLQLYNLENDIGETTNVADAHAQIVAELTQLHEEWRSQMSRK